MIEALLAHRGILSVKGEDAADFLQGLVSADVLSLPRNEATWSGLLTAQGRLLHEFFIFKREENFILLESDKDALDDLKKRLMRRRLRSRVDIEESSWQVAVSWGEEQDEALRGKAIHDDHGYGFYDPRLAQLGKRLWRKSKNQPLSHDEASVMAYRDFRYQWAVMEGREDYVQGETLPLAYHMEHLHGISMEKGCYMGQEVTARLYHRHALKKRVVAIQRKAGEWNDQPLCDKDGKEIGKLCCHANHWGLLLCPHDVERQSLINDGGEFIIHIPAWLERAIKNRANERHP